jgi:acetyl-CoA synthetase
LCPGVKGTPELLEELAKQTAHNMGSAVKPEKIYFVSALPKTRSGKIVRGSIRRKYLGEPTGDLSSVENPDALDAIPTRS